MSYLNDRQDEILYFFQKKHENIVNVFGLSLFNTGDGNTSLGNFVTNKNNYKDVSSTLQELDSAIENDPYVKNHKWKEHLRKIVIDSKNKIILIVSVPSNKSVLSTSFAEIIQNQITINNGNCILRNDMIKKCKEYNAKDTQGVLPDDIYKINELEIKTLQQSSIVILVDDTIGEGNTLLNISDKILKINPNIIIYIISLCINKTSKGKKR